MLQDDLEQIPVEDTPTLHSPTYNLGSLSSQIFIKTKTIFYNIFSNWFDMVFVWVKTTINPIKRADTVHIPWNKFSVIPHNHRDVFSSLRR